MFPCDRFSSWHCLDRCGVYLTEEEKEDIPNGGKKVPTFRFRNIAFRLEILRLANMRLAT